MEKIYEHLQTIIQNLKESSEVQLTGHNNWSSYSCTSHRAGTGCNPHEGADGNYDGGYFYIQQFWRSIHGSSGDSYLNNK